MRNVVVLLFLVALVAPASLVVSLGWRGEDLPAWGLASPFVVALVIVWRGREPQKKKARFETIEGGREFHG